MQDKKKATILVFETTLKSKSGELLAKITSHIFIRGIGGFGQKGKIKNVFEKIPNRPPDAISEQKTSPFQAFLYGLNGDNNPLHLDPRISKIAGFDVPILQGLC